MPIAYKGADAKCLFGDGDGLLIDLSPDAGELSIELSPAFSDLEVFDQLFVGRAGTSMDASASLSTLYYGEAARRVRDAAASASRASSSALALTHPQMGAWVMGVVPEGMAVDAPYDGLASASPTLPASGPVCYAPTTGKGTLTSAYQTLPSKPADSAYTHLWAIVETTSAQTTTFTVADAGSGLSDPISAKPGVYAIYGLPSAPTRYKAAATPTGVVSVTFLYARQIIVE